MNKKIAAVLLLGFYGQQVDAMDANNILEIDVLGISRDGQPSSAVSQGQGTWTDVVSPDALNWNQNSLGSNPSSPSGSRSRSRANSNASDASSVFEATVPIELDDVPCIYDRFNLKVNRFMNCSDLTIIEGPIKNGKKIKATMSQSSEDFAASARNIVVTSTPDSYEQEGIKKPSNNSQVKNTEKGTYSVTPVEDVLKPESTSVVSNEKMKSGKNEANTFWADTGLLVGWPVVGAIASAACPPLIVPCMATAALQDTFSVRRKKIHTNTDSGWSNVGHTLLSLRIFAPILAYAGMMYVAPEKTSDTFKQVAGPVCVGLTAAVAAENIYQTRRFHQKAVQYSGSCNGESYSDDKSRVRGRLYKAENSTWANDETLKKYNALRHGSVAGFIYGPKPEFVKNPETGGYQV